VVPAVRWCRRFGGAGGSVVDYVIYLGYDSCHMSNHSTRKVSRQPSLASRDDSSRVNKAGNTTIVISSFCGLH
jgi:hypothetical protein